MLSKLKKITEEATKTPGAEYKEKDEAVLDYLLDLAKKAYAQLEETAREGKTRKYVIGYERIRNLEYVIKISYNNKYQTRLFFKKEVERLLKKFIENMGMMFDIPLKYDPSKHWHYEDNYYIVRIGDLYFDWSDEVTVSDEPDEDTSC